MAKHQLCRNCGKEVSDIYCSHCGQKNDVERLRWATLADGFISSFVGDGAIGDKRSNIRYGFMLTIWSVLIRPGQTVAEFLEGRRRKYFNPVTILLLLSGFYALLASFIGVVDPEPKPSDDALGTYFNIFWAYCNSHPAMWDLLLLPFTALALKWIFRKHSDLRFVEYMYIGIFVAIFSMLILFVKLPYELLPEDAALRGYFWIVSFPAKCWFSVAIYRMLFPIGVKRAVWRWMKSIIVSYTLAFLTVIVTAMLALGIYYLISPSKFEKRAGEVIELFDKENGGSTSPADSLIVK